MIRRLRTRRRVDTAAREVRSAPARWGRLIYLSLLTVFFAGIANYLFGSIFLLRAPGLLMQAQYTVAPPYEARVVKINVKPGEVVDPDTPLVEVESPVLARAIADLSLRQAELKSKVEQIRSRLAFANTMLPIARQQVDNARRSIEFLDRLETRQLASLKRREDVNSANYTAQSHLADLETQQRSLARELETNSAALTEAEMMYRQFKDLYNGGALYAPAAGVVGARVAAEGDVLVPGNRVLTIHSGPPYVMAYLPSSYAFPVSVGQNVHVSSGSRAVVGTIRSVLAVADALPAEFQSGLKPRDRSQLVRISLPDYSGFAAQQYVQVASCLSETCDTWDKLANQTRELAQAAKVLATKIKAYVIASQRAMRLERPE